MNDEGTEPRGYPVTARYRQKRKSMIPGVGSQVPVIQDYEIDFMKWAKILNERDGSDHHILKNRMEDLKLRVTEMNGRER